MRLHLVLFNSCLEEIASDDSCTSIITEEQQLIRREHGLCLNELFYVFDVLTVINYSKIAVFTVAMKSSLRERETTQRLTHPLSFSVPLNIFPHQTPIR